MNEEINNALSFFTVLSKQCSVFLLVIVTGNGQKVPNYYLVILPLLAALGGTKTWLLSLELQQ